MPRPGQSYSYHETFRLFLHDTGYGVCTAQIPCLGVGATPEHALADLVQRLHRTRLASILAYASGPDDAPVPPDLDYFDGRLSLQVSGQPGMCRYQVHLLDRVASVEGALGIPLPLRAFVSLLSPGGLDPPRQRAQDASRREGRH